MADPAAQRVYRAPCPGCGAPVVFQSAQATHAVCAYCHSMVVRSGEALQRVGRVAELFDDHSPLQIGAAGRITLDGGAQPFTLIGRVQYLGDAGRWTEWTALLPGGQKAITALTGSASGIIRYSCRIPALKKQMYMT